MVMERENMTQHAHNDVCNDTENHDHKVATGSFSNLSHELIENKLPNHNNRPLSSHSDDTSCVSCVKSDLYNIITCKPPVKSFTPPNHSILKNGFDGERNHYRIKNRNKEDGETRLPGPNSGNTLTKHDRLTSPESPKTSPEIVTPSLDNLHFSVQKRGPEVANRRNYGSKNKSKVNFQEEVFNLPRHSLLITSDYCEKEVNSEKLRKVTDHEDLQNCLQIEKVKEIEQLRKDLDSIQRKLCELEKHIGNNESAESDQNAVKEEIKTLENTQLTAQQRANRNRVIINIGGIKHEIYRSTLKNIPDTRLSWIAEDSAVHSPEYDPITSEFFFDRHPQVFSHILNYYRTGNLHVPYDVCGPLFEDELQYWGIDDSQVESCCWLSYRQHRDAQETLKEFEGIEFERDFDDDSEPDLTKYGFNIEGLDAVNEELTWYQRWQPFIWKLMEEPHSSLKAKILAYISMFLITLSVFLFCLETMSFFQTTDRKTVINILEGLCVLYFTIELSVRFAFCPNIILFLKDIMNWIDLLAIIPFFVTIIIKYGLKSNDDVRFLQSIRVIRVFRIIKLSKHSVGLQILGHTLKASFRELLLLIFFLIIGIIIFSSLVYYCERQQKDTKFKSIPATFWWAVITMTTVGYGDIVPETVEGKIIGSLCAITGVLMIALPVPVIVNNFNLYYSHAQARLKLPKKKRRMLCGAANALKGPAMEEFERREEQGESSESLQDINNPRKYSGDPDFHEKGDEHDGDEHDGVENAIGHDGDNLVSLRMKKFGRRDSNIFACQTHKNGDLSPHANNRNSYAMHKRRSLLPTMTSLPEIEH